MQLRRLLLAILLVTGCKHVPRFEVDRDRLSADIERRSSAIVARPDVDKAFDSMMEAVFREPGVSEAGRQLMASLGAAPALKPGADAILARLVQSPAMQAMARELVRDNPGASADRIGELAGQRVSAVTDNPIFDHAFDHAFSTLLARPDITATFHQLGAHVGSSTQLLAALTETMDRRLSDARIRQRLQELNGGQAPDRQQATTLLLSHAFSDARLARFYIDLAALPVVKRELATALKSLAGEPAFVTRATDAVVRCVNDAAFRDGVQDTMSLLLSKDVDEPKLTAAMERLMATPVVGDALTSMAARVLDDPAIGRIGTRALTALAADPDFRALIVRLCDDW